MSSLLVTLIFLPLVGAVFVLSIGNRRPAMVRSVSLAITAASLMLAAVVVARYQVPSEATDVNPQMVTRAHWMSFALPRIVSQQSVQPTRVWIDFYIGVDGISLWLVALTSLLMVSAVLISWTSVTERVAEYHALLLSLETAMLGVFCSFDLILFYIFFEFTLIPLYFLIGIWGGPRRTLAAGKFFIYTLTGSLLSLLGLLALVLALNNRSPDTMTFSIPELKRGVDRQMALSEDASLHGTPTTPLAVKEASRDDVKRFWYRAQWWIFLALFAGFAVKVPLAPFHTWLPLAHVEAPTAGSVLLAGVLLKLGTYGFLRLCLPLLPYGTWNLGVPLVATLSVIGIIYGSLCALAQTDVKRLVAYSSVAHLGFCMLGMFALNIEGVTGSYLQMVNHGLSTGALFLLVGMLYERYHTRQMEEMGGLAARLPLLTFLMIFTCLSSMGLPGLNGFVGEVLILMGMFKANVVYAVFGASGVVLGAWYLLNMIQRVFFGPLHEPSHGHHPHAQDDAHHSTETESVHGHHSHAHGAAPALPPSSIRDLNSRELWAVVPICLLCLWFGVYPQTIIRTVEPDLKPLLRSYERSQTLTPPSSADTLVAEVN